MLKRNINKILNKIGVKVVRTTPLNKKHIKPSKTLYVEFIGVSEAGMESLYKEVKAKRGARKDWIDVKEFIH